MKKNGKYHYTTHTLQKHILTLHGEYKITHDQLLLLLLQKKKNEKKE